MLSDLSEFHAVVGARVLRQFDWLEGIQVLQLPGHGSVPEWVRLYEDNGWVEFAEPDHLLHPATVPDYSKGTHPKTCSKTCFQQEPQRGGIGNDARSIDHPRRCRPLGLGVRGRRAWATKMPAPTRCEGFGCGGGGQG